MIRIVQTDIVFAVEVFTTPLLQKAGVFGNVVSNRCSASPRVAFHADVSHGCTEDELARLGPEVP
jgi:hypothetical protein